MGDASSFIDANGVRRRAPPAPSASAWLDSFGLSSLTTSSSTREASAEEVDGACEACEATRDVVRATARRRARGLELACGSGKYLRALRDEGFDVMGVEPRIGNARDGAAGLLAEGVVAAAPLRTLPFSERFSITCSRLRCSGRCGRRRRRKTSILSSMKRLEWPSTGRGWCSRREERSTVARCGGGGDFKSRRWWMDTFCAHGWVEDTDAFLSLVKSKDGTSSKTGPRNWFVLKRVRKIKKRGKCTSPCRRAKTRRTLRRRGSTKGEGRSEGVLEESAGVRPPPRDWFEQQFFINSYALSTEASRCPIQLSKQQLSLVRNRRENGVKFPH